MGFYVASSFVLCTLMLLSITDADEYPGENIFSGIHLHKCDNVGDVSEGVMNCIRTNAQPVDKYDELVVISASQTEAMINGLCSAKVNVTACVTTLFKDCPNKGEIMEGYLGRYLVCDGNKPADWITQWAQVNSEAKITGECHDVVYRGSIGDTISKCMNPEWLKEFDWNTLNVTIGEQIMRRFVSEVFNCALDELIVHGSDIGNEPACVDSATWEDILIMASLYLSSPNQIPYGFYLSKEDMKTVRKYAASSNFGMGARIGLW